MKKIYVSILALCLFICANAAPAFVNKAANMKADFSFNSFSSKTSSPILNQVAKKRLTTLGLPTELNISELPEDAPKLKIGQQPMHIAPVARKAANASVSNLTIKEGQATYWGTYYYARFQQFIGYIWELYFTTNEGYEIIVEFEGLSDTRIEGKYTPDYVTIVAGNDTTDAEGTLNIAYFSTGTTYSPTYTFSGTFTDEQGNTYNLSGNYAFQYVFDYYFYVLCRQGNQQACYYQVFALEDKPVTPSTDTIPVVITGNVKKSYYAGEGWSVYAKDKEAYFATFINSETLEGTYTNPDMFDIASTRFVAMEDTTIIELKQINGAIITKNENNYAFRFYAMDLEGQMYDIQMKYTLPIPVGDTIYLSAAGTALYSDMREKYGAILVQGKDTINHCVISNAIYADSLSGRYTEMDGYNGNYYDYIVVYGEKDTVQYIADRYTVILDSAITQGGFVMLYHIMLFIGVNPEDDSDVKAFFTYMAAVQPFAMDSEEDVSATFTSSIEKTIITALYPVLEAVYISINNEEGYLLGVAFPKTLDPVTGIPEGTYPIKSTYQYNTMLASEGIAMTDWNTNEPSYFINKDGIWYIVSGTMTMSANSLVINGINSNGKKVDITINFTPTDDEQIKEDTQLIPTKMLFKNHFMIMKNSKFFNASGLEMK
ncbi:MAG: hypothetical protein MJZ64_04935 [Paludibacteraceae bacterium]|nr:hypothetical protein [Paludibacteraceae bacterium]